MTTKTAANAALAALDADTPTHRTRGPAIKFDALMGKEGAAALAAAVAGPTTLDVTDFVGTPGDRLAREVSREAVTLGTPDGDAAIAADPAAQANAASWMKENGGPVMPANRPPVSAGTREAKRARTIAAPKKAEDQAAVDAAIATAADKKAAVAARKAAKAQDKAADGDKVDKLARPGKGAAGKTSVPAEKAPDAPAPKPVGEVDGVPYYNLSRLNEAKRAKAAREKAATTPSTVTPAPAAAKGKRAQAETDAANGILPPDPTVTRGDSNKRWIAPMDRLIAARDAGDIDALKAEVLPTYSSTPKALGKFRDLCVVALEARAAKGAA